MLIYDHKQYICRDFPGGPVVKISSSNARSAGSVRGRGAEMPQALGPKNQKIKQKQYCNKFYKDLKMVHIKNNILKKKEKQKRTSLLRLHAPNAGGATERSHMQPQRSKILRAVAKTQCSQRNKQISIMNILK